MAYVYFPGLVLSYLQLTHSVRVGKSWCDCFFFFLIKRKFVVTRSANLEINLLCPYIIIKYVVDWARSITYNS